VGWVRFVWRCAVSLSSATPRGAGAQRGAFSRVVGGAEVQRRGRRVGSWWRQRHAGGQRGARRHMPRGARARLAPFAGGRAGRGTAFGAFCRVQPGAQARGAATRGRGHARAVGHAYEGAKLGATRPRRIDRLCAAGYLAPGGLGKRGPPARRVRPEPPPPSAAAAARAAVTAPGTGGRCGGRCLGSRACSTWRRRCRRRPGRATGGTCRRPPRGNG
jgi:hypothetical protein